MTQVQLKEGAMNVVDTVIVFRILKMLTRKWSEYEAFEFGLIDDNGKRIKSKKPKTSKEKNSFTLLHRLVFNLKRILELLPFGRTRLASYAAALALLKENFNIDGKYLDTLLSNDFVGDQLNALQSDPETLGKYIKAFNAYQDDPSYNHLFRKEIPYAGQRVSVYDLLLLNQQVSQ